MFRRFNRFLLFLIPSALLFAQPETATLRGTVTDSSGTPLEGIQLVDLRDRQGTVGTRNLHRRGRLYDAPFLRPGSYIVKIDANHFQTFEADGILLIAGQVRRFDAQLKPEARDETVLRQRTARRWCNRKTARCPASSTSSSPGRTLRLSTCTLRCFRC